MMSFALPIIWILSEAVLLLPLFLGQVWAGAWDLQAGQGAVLVIPKGKLPEGSGGNILRRSGGIIIADGISDSTLQLRAGEFLVLDAARLINQNAGSVVFWVRPHWEDNEAASHTFLSLPWQDGKEGYLVISRGWWEPAGAGLTYFVGNNQDYANLARRIRYTRNEWTHLACVWQGGKPGFIKLYVNGILVAENKRYTGDYLPGKELILGSDRGTPLANGRWADADLDELAFFPRSLSGNDIYALYDRQNPTRLEPPIDADGRLIETRAIFDEGVGWQIENGAREIIQRIKRAGFNVYIPCVWHGNGARYPSMLATSEPGQRFFGNDPLARLIDIAHQNGIQVHPWFTVALREKQFARGHQEFFDATTPSDAFDLHRQAFRRFIIELIADVAQRYPIDGVNLDYIRTMGTCRCESCQAGYRQRYNRDLLEDAAYPKKDGTLESHVQEWHDSAVETVVREVAQRVRRLRPGSIISVDGNPQPFPNPEGRQEARWANAGLVDMVFDMEYSEPPDVERHHLVAAQFRDPRKLVLLISNHDWKAGKPLPKQANQMKMSTAYIRNRWGKGLGIYLYSMLSDDQVEALVQGPFKRAARPPARVDVTELN